MHPAAGSHSEPFASGGRGEIPAQPAGRLPLVPGPPYPGRVHQSRLPFLRAEALPRRVGRGGHLGWGLERENVPFPKLNPGWVAGRGARRPQTMGRHPDLRVHPASIESALDAIARGHHRGAWGRLSRGPWVPGSCIGLVGARIPKPHGSGGGARCAVLVRSRVVMIVYAREGQIWTTIASGSGRSRGVRRCDSS